MCSHPECNIIVQQGDDINNCMKYAGSLTGLLYGKSPFMLSGLPIIRAVTFSHKIKYSSNRATELPAAAHC